MDVKDYNLRVSHVLVEDPRFAEDTDEIKKALKKIPTVKSIQDRVKGILSK